jgi:hypothetical protein
MAAIGFRDTIPHMCNNYRNRSPAAEVARTFQVDLPNIAAFNVPEEVYPGYPIAAMNYSLMSDLGLDVAQMESDNSDANPIRTRVAVTDVRSGYT